jgi:biopolymer transport protein ExbD
MARTALPAHVEIPIAPMLDMAFNLLAFFVMTFNPAPIEVQYTMNLLPGQPQARPDEAPSEDQQATSTELPAALKTLTTNLYADSGGQLSRVTIGEIEVQGMPQLRQRLKEILSDKTLPFDQALIQFDPDLHYGELMQVIDIFNGEGITKISFAELDPNTSGFVPGL